MPSETYPPEAEAPLRQVVGYLNFSEGNSDSATLAALNRLYGLAAADRPLAGMPPWQRVREWLTTACDRCEGDSAAFRDLGRARAAIARVWGQVLPAYLDFHRDLLFHQLPENLFNGFFLGRCIEATLRWAMDDVPEDAAAERAIAQLNDFVGFRPVAVLEGRELEPYPHEWVRPVPLYIAGAGVAEGPYHRLISRALAILRATDESLRRAAHFDFDALEELAIDPRAFDFDHPVARRPNYQFGQWDPHRVDGEGRYRRFVVQQVTVDALLSRLEEEPDAPRDQLLEEAAAVLAGTILMASGISGWGPAAHPSTTTLTDLLGVIAAYRDRFYDALLERMSGPHADRLRQEAESRRQPFGAARQHLNTALARLRARQLQHVQLARLYARMGYPEAAERQSDVVAVPSARLACRIDCMVTLGRRALRQGQLARAAEVPQQAFDLIDRGIQCGALVDPWNILGFAANFARFHGPESGLHDHRVDDLVTLIERLFGYLARVWSEAAARDDEQVYAAMEQLFREQAEWWRQFAAHEVESLSAVDPLDSYESARLVARALRLWHRGGAAAGNVKFWAPHAELFDSPRAYALVIDALLERNDFVAAMALLVHWMAAVDRVGLRRGESSLPRHAERWMVRLRDAARAEDAERAVGCPWSLVRKFFDFLEANAEHYWQPPEFALARPARRRPRDWDRELAEADLAGEGDEDEGGLFDAAYEGVTYQDTTDDGVEGAVFEEGGDASEDELQAESRRVMEHLEFLSSLARLWGLATDLAAEGSGQGGADAALLRDRAEVMAEWAQRAAENRHGLFQLLDDVRGYRIPTGGADGDSMSQYDRRRVVRDSLLERILATAVEMSDARRLLVGVLGSSEEGGEHGDRLAESMSDDDQQAVRMYAALVAGNAEQVTQQFGPLLAALRDKSLLYIPLSRGGDPVKIFAARLRQRVLAHLLEWLPRRGHFREACRLIETARLMEQYNPVGPGAVTEFDGLFRTGFRAQVDALIATARHWEQQRGAQPARLELIELLELLTETLLSSWLAHSRTLRLSALETVSGRESWTRLVEFIRRYGDPIFTQSFLKLRNVRAILHQGVGPWLERLEQDPDELADTPLIRDLGGRLSHKAAEQHLSVVFEAIMDHHAEFRDYNSTTTQSDRGDLLYMFLEFLRLRVRYDRIAWNLRPVMWAHELLVRRGMDRAAAQWRRSLANRIGSEADQFVAHLRKLQEEYAMRMPTVADRILERFIQPMTIDRMRALVKPAIDDAEHGRESPAFSLLQQEADLLARNPVGVGLDLPAWLAALDEEATELLARGETGVEITPHNMITIERTILDFEELKHQLVAAKQQGRRLPHFR